MKNVFFIIILISVSSCLKKNDIQTNNVSKNSYHKKAEYFRDSKALDSSFYYYYLAKENYAKNNDSIKTAESLINMALIQTAKGDFYGSIETSLSANKLLTDDNNLLVKRDLAISYNNMGIASGFLYNYDNGIIFYKKAAEYALKKEDALLCYNNVAVAYLYKKNTKLARKYLNLAITSKKASTYSKALNNLGKLKSYENPDYSPLPEYYKALKIRLDSSDTEGLNSSYSTLSDYFEDKEKDKSLAYAKKMLETADEINNPEDQMQALQKLIVLDQANYLKYFEKFQSLNDSLIIARGKARNQFALIRYETEKNKANFLKSEANNSQKQNRILKLYFGLTILVISLIALFSINKRRHKQLKQEKELEVKNTQLKMSKRVHDVVANGIYQVMAKIENQEDFDRDKTLDELEFVYEKSRDISYEKAGEEKEFSQEISGLIASFNNVEVKTFTAGNTAEIWQTVSPEVKEEVYQMIRELMVNMKKHSRASHVALRFEKTGDTIDIQYKDNGIGISGDLIYKNGLRNTASRMEAIGGTITFDTKIEKGLKVNLSFPAS